MLKERSKYEEGENYCIPEHIIHVNATDCTVV